MYEGLYGPIPSVRAYWERLGMDQPASPLTKNDLDQMIFAHQLRIPFENLDVCDLHRSPSLDIRDIFEKIIVGERGGYCFELNALFEALLKSCGVETMPCLGRSLKDKGYVYPLLHRSTVVTLGKQRYLAEVGYGGPSPAAAVPLVDGLDFESQGQAFRIELHDSCWWHIVYNGTVAKGATVGECGGRTAPTPVFAILDAPVALTDFVPLSYYCSTHPDSVFVQQRMVNRRTEDGSVSITADAITRTASGCKEKRAIGSEAEYRSLLKEHFGIVLPT